MSKFQEGLDYFTSKGLSAAQAAGIMGNLSYESGGLNTKAVGDGGKAYGLAQWHPDRQAEFKKVFGKDIRDSSYAEQLEFVWHELQNKEKSALNALLGETTIGGAVKSFMNMFERPSDAAKASTIDDRTAAAGGTMAESEGGIGGAISSALTPEWIANLLNGKTAARWAAVVIGIILIGLAVAAFVLKSDTLKEVIPNVG